MLKSRPVNTALAWAPQRVSRCSLSACCPQGNRTCAVTGMRVPPEGTEVLAFSTLLPAGQPHLPGHGHAAAPPGAHAQLCHAQRHHGARTAPLPQTNADTNSYVLHAQGLVTASKAYVPHDATV